MSISPRPQTEITFSTSSRTVRFSEMFVGILGHDLRNPLSAIATASTYLLRRVGDDKLARTVGRIVSSSVSVANEIAIVPVPAAFCPFTSPFLVPASVVIRADGASDLLLREMQLRFVDLAGVTGAFRTINGTELTTLFGSTLIPAFGTRTFPVSLPIGCVGGSTGTLFIHPVASSGAPHRRAYDPLGGGSAADAAGDHELSARSVNQRD